MQKNPCRCRTKGVHLPHITLATIEGPPTEKIEQKLIEWFKDKGLEMPDAYRSQRRQGVGKFTLETSGEDVEIYTRNEWRICEIYTRSECVFVQSEVLQATYRPRANSHGSMQSSEKQ